MFFTPELLSRRDSGFGLLWLAATLGSKSSFKKLPKRSILTADIAQLCELISEPAEPLALRLSSNLMFGVVRVYKVKQEIFMADVSNCVSSLKKVVQDLRNSMASDGQVQMVNPVARSSALTIMPDPKAAYALNYDAFIADWDEYLAVGADSHDNGHASEDADYGTKSKANNLSKSQPRSVPPTETLRKEVHTLDEHYDHLLSASFDLSFHEPGGGDVSSSQAERAFDDFFAFSDGMDLGDCLGDDLARELGWDASPARSIHSTRPRTRIERDEDNFVTEDGGATEYNMDFNGVVDDMQTLAGEAGPENLFRTEQLQLEQSPKKSKTGGKENSIPPSRCQSVLSRAASPAIFFSQLLLSQDLVESQPLKDITEQEWNNTNRPDKIGRVKRTRLLLDARTELTDDELRIARAKYVQSQNRIKKEVILKRHEKESGKLVEELVWGAPKGVEAKGLIDFWQENFRVQVEARSGAIRIHNEIDEPPVKRRKMKHTHIQEDLDPSGPEPMDFATDMAYQVNYNLDMNHDVEMVTDDMNDLRHSSEEPGQARRISRSASLIGTGHPGFDLGPKSLGHSSQKSSLFPWDNAGGSSLSGGPLVHGGSDHLIDNPDIHLRSSSLNHQESPLPSVQRGSIIDALSPALSGGRASELIAEDFVFDVDNAQAVGDTQQDTQKSDMNLISLERNSFNFLEYARMQFQSLSKPNDQLTFEKVVPRATSNRHVASAAFYHCLVLATKNLLRLEQPSQHEPVVMIIV